MRKIKKYRIDMMKEEEALKNKIAALSGIDDIYLDTICRQCKNLVIAQGGEYLDFLNQIVVKLLNGWSIEYISYCLQGNKYTSYKGEENIMPTKFELPTGQWIPLVFEPEFVKVADVNIIVPNKVVEVTFADGTKEKSVCREPDIFSLESAISICISKKIMGGSGAYNNAVKCGMKVYKGKLKKEDADKAEQERIEKKHAKRVAYKERRAAKRAEEESKRREQKKEEQIEIQKEAYLRAIKEIENSKNMVAEARH